MHSYCHRFFLLCLLLGSLLAAPWLLAAEKSRTVDISGEWIGKAELSQLGFIEPSFIFNKDGSFIQKLNFLSFCGIKAITPDCQYFWMVIEGRYVAGKNTLHLDIKKSYSQLLSVGLFRPVKREMKNETRAEDLSMEIKEGNLNIIDKDKKIQVFKRVN